MLSEHAQSLQSQAKALKRKASELTATKRKEEKIERRQRAKCRRMLEKHEDIGTILLAKRGADFEMLREYFAKQVEDERGPEDFVHRVSEKFLAMSDAEVTACVDDTTKGSAAKLAAERFLLEYSVHSWIGEQNSKKGVAPSVGDIVRQVEETRRALQRRGQVVQQSKQTFHGAYKWIQRFRRRWRVRSAQVAYHELESVEQARAKAGACDQRSEGSLWLPDRRSKFPRRFVLCELAGEGPQVCGQVGTIFGRVFGTT